MGKIEVTVRNKTIASKDGYTIDAVDTLVRASAMMQKTAQTKMQRGFPVSAKFTKSSVFFLLIDTSPYEPRTENCSSVLKFKRSRQKRKAFGNLFNWCSCGMRDTTWYQMVKYKEIYAEGYSAGGWEKNNVSLRDLWLRSVAATKAFKKS